MSTTFCCFELGGSKRRGTRQRADRNSIRNNPSEVNQNNLTLSTFGNGRAFSERRSINFGGSLWRSQFESKEAFKDLLGGIQKPMHATTLSMQDASNDTDYYQYQSMITQTSPKGMGPNSPSAQFTINQTYECIQKFFRFQCNKCRKVFKKVITNEIANSMVNIEETLNQQQSKQILSELQIDGLCPQCNNQNCNLLDVQTLLAGYGNDMKSGSPIKEMIEEEEEEDIVVDDQDQQKQLEEVKIGKPEREDKEESKVVLEPQEMIGGGENSHKLCDGSVPNTLIQSYFPNQDKQRLAAGGVGDSSYNQEGIMNGLQAQEQAETGKDGNRISILAQTYQIKSKGTQKKPAEITAGKAKETDYFQFDTDETTTNLTSNLQSRLIKSKGNQINNGGHSMLHSKPDEEACRTFNADIMRALVARKMSKNKTFYEIKMIQQSQIHAGFGHLHGISAGANVGLGGGPAGHMSHQPMNSARPHLSTAQQNPQTARLARQTHGYPQGVMSNPGHQTNRMVSGSQQVMF